MALRTVPIAKAIVCFGDSITFMAAARADRGYPPWLDEKLYTLGFSVGNYGISGGGYVNAKDAYDLFHRNRGLWGACVLVGVNDIAAGETAATVFAGINAFVQEMLTDGLYVFVSTILPWKSGGGWTAPRQVVTEDVNASIRALADTHARLFVVDGYNELGQVDDPTLLRRDLQEVTPDALHLGSNGAEMLAQLFADKITDVVGDTSNPVVTNVTPASGSVIVSDTPIAFDVTDAGGNLSRTNVSVYYPSLQRWEVLFYAAISGAWGARGEGFGPQYTGTRTAIANGFAFTNVKRRGGWPARPVLVVDPVDSVGNEAA